MSRRLFGAACSVLLLMACVRVPAPAAMPQPVPPTDVSSLEALVDAQLHAYNRRDLEGFLSYYSDDASTFTYPQQLRAAGKDQLRTRYARTFANPNIRASIIKRMIFGRFVIDHEILTGRNGPDFETVAIYEIKDGKIVNVTFLDR